MNAAQYERLRRSFHAALELDGSDRDEAILRAFPDDPDLREELRRLLEETEGCDVLSSAAAAEQVRRRIVDAVDPAADRSMNDDDHLIGRQIGSFRIERRIGRGGASTVYLASDTANPKRHVALKVLDVPRSSDRFEREAAMLQRLEHVGIARFIQAGAAEIDRRERLWLATEFIDGPSIIDHARRRRLDSRQRLELFAYICTAVAHAHERGIVHRDLKPGNILVTPGGQPKVVDFGVAKLLVEDEDAGRTLEGELIGTVAYMSPEQALGGRGDVSPRSDVYALGVIGFELLTGRLPHDLAGRSIHEQLAIVRDRPPSRPREIDPSISPEIESILLRAMEKSSADRYPDARALASALRASLRGEPPAAETIRRTRRSEQRPRRLVAAGPALAFLLVIALAFVSGMALESWRGRDTPPAASGEASDHETTAEVRGDRALRLLRFEADQHAASGRHAEAATLYRELVDLSTNSAAMISSVIVLKERLGESLLLSADPAGAVGVLDEVVRTRASVDGPGDWRTIEARVLLGRALAAAGRREEAIEQLQAALDSRRRAFGPDDSAAATVERLLSELRDDE